MHLIISVQRLGFFGDNNLSKDISEKNDKVVVTSPKVIIFNNSILMSGFVHRYYMLVLQVIKH